MIHPVTGRNIESLTLRISHAPRTMPMVPAAASMDVVPARVLMQGRDGADVSDEEHRQDDPGRVRAPNRNAKIVRAAG